MGKILSLFGLGSPWLLLSVGLLSSVVSGSIVWKVSDWRASAAIGEVQHSFDLYKAGALEDAVLANQSALRSLNSSIDNLRRLQSQTLATQQSQSTSSKQLLEKLSATPDTGCGPDTAYLNGLRDLQATRPVH